MTPAITPTPTVHDLLIRPFQPQDGVAFRALNEEWIIKYFTLEEPDRVVLNDPERYVLQRGGYILMAIADDRPIGCCALLPAGSGVFEVAKMAVAEQYRGRGVGRKILEYTIAYAKAHGAAVLYLETNNRLANAIHLYEALGFRHLPPERVHPSPYARSNVNMELIL